MERISESDEVLLRGLAFRAPYVNASFIAHSVASDPVNSRNTFSSGGGAICRELLDQLDPGLVRETIGVVQPGLELLPDCLDHPGVPVTHRGDEHPAEKSIHWLPYGSRM